jgi:hypothetical protein
MLFLQVDQSFIQALNKLLITILRTCSGMSAVPLEGKYVRPSLIRSLRAAVLQHRCLYCKGLGECLRAHVLGTRGRSEDVEQALTTTVRSFGATGHICAHFGVFF